MLTNLFLAKQKATAIGLQWFDEDFYLLLIRLCVNIVFITILIRFLYYAKTKRKDYLFTYYLIGTITFFLCFGLKKLDIDTGMGLGLFAIFGIIRYRTDAIEIKEMTYLFLIIGLSVVNALASNQLSVAEMAFLEKSFKEAKRLNATISNSFSRITLVHKEKTERLTFDLNIQFQDRTKTKSLTNLVICELKQGARNRSSIFYQMTKKRLIRPLRVSKYCLGMMNFYSALELKQNRFKKKTLSLNKIIC